MASKIPVTICIPAYQAEKFLEETIESALHQTWPIRLAISVDRSSDNTGVIAERAARSSASITVVSMQKSRKGWIGNTNAALRLAQTRYFMNLPHDDVLEPTYVEECMEALRNSPDAAVAYSDLKRHGGDETPIAIQHSIVGSVEARLQQVLRDGFPAVAVRGVVDRTRASRFLVPNAWLGFAADTLWFAKIAAQAPLVRVPKVLYQKRLHECSTHSAWYRASAEELDERWVVHCWEMAKTILCQRPGLIWSEPLRQAFKERVLRQGEAHFAQRRKVPLCIRPDRNLYGEIVRVVLSARQRK